MQDPALHAVISNEVRNPGGGGGLSRPTGRKVHQLHRFLDPAKHALRYEGSARSPKKHPGQQAPGESPTWLPDGSGCATHELENVAHNNQRQNHDKADDAST